MTESKNFTAYEKFVIAILAFLQFTIILDFMIISPLGAMLIPALQITAKQFGVVVSVYAFSAGTSGILAAGFADRFDRKKLLMFFYCGFLLGTLLCGLAKTYEFLLFARMVTGIFGGVIGSVVFAITTDLFPIHMRGRVMGFVQTAFAASQILGIPAGLYLSNHWGWNMPFYAIVAFGVAVGLLMNFKLQPINEHLKVQSDRTPLIHLWKTVSTPKYIHAFATTALLSTGGFMLMPFSSAFTVNNLGIPLETLPFIYLVTGITTMIAGPYIGKLADRIGKFKVFLGGTIVSMITVLIYSSLGRTPLLGVLVLNVVMFVGIFSRMIPAQALMSQIPQLSDRGAFMSVSSSVQQIAGGIASILAGLIVIVPQVGELQHFNTLGYVVTAANLVTLIMMASIRKRVEQQ